MKMSKCISKASTENFSVSVKKQQNPILAPNLLETEVYSSYETLLQTCKSFVLILLP